VPHCVERFPLLSKLEASWKSTGVNACLFESAAHLNVFPAGVPGLHSLTHHVWRDRSCRGADAPCVAVSRQPRGDVTGTRPGATIGALDQGVPSAARSARSTKAEDKALPPGGQPKVLSACRLPLQSGEEPSASPLAGRRPWPPLTQLCYICQGSSTHLPQEVGGK
jgi:hypothetical protein